MEPTNFLLTVGLLVMILETAYGISCYSCTSTGDGCKEENFNKFQASKKSGCDICSTLYASSPTNHVIRGCRPNDGGYYQEGCKDTTLGDKRCYCTTDLCNDAGMDERVSSKGDTGTKRPPSEAVSWRMSGMILVVLMLLRKFFI